MVSLARSREQERYQLCQKPNTNSKYNKLARIGLVLRLRLIPPNNRQSRHNTDINQPPRSFSHADGGKSKNFSPLRARRTLRKTFCLLCSSASSAPPRWIFYFPMAQSAAMRNCVYADGKSDTMLEKKAMIRSAFSPNSGLPASRSSRNRLRAATELDDGTAPS